MVAVSACASNGVADGYRSGLWVWISFTAAIKQNLVNW